MLDGLHAPCCPYCGGEMAITIKRLKNMTIYWYECDNCMSSSPAAKRARTFGLCTGKKRPIMF